jgi:hypothetical protein
VELAVEFIGIRARIELPEEQAWEVLRFAGSLHTGASMGSKTFTTTPYVGSSRKGLQTPRRPAKSQAERIREVVGPVLADGHGHERRELARTVREAGLKVAGLDSALKGHFYRFENGHGRPAYRDPSVEAPWGKSEKPDWF